MSGVLSAAQGDEAPKREGTRRPITVLIVRSNWCRHMTKGQRAMAVTMVCPESSKLKRGGSSETEDHDAHGPP